MPPDWRVNRCGGDGNGVNENLARRWVVAVEQGASGGGRLLADVSGVAHTPAFVPVQLRCASPTPDIRIELRRGRAVRGVDARAVAVILR